MKIDIIFEHLTGYNKETFPLMFITYSTGKVYAENEKMKMNCQLLLAIWSTKTLSYGKN